MGTRRVRRNRNVGNKINDLESRVIANEKKAIQDSTIGSTQIAEQGVATDNVQDRAVTASKIEVGAISTEHLSQINEVSSGGNFAINVGEEGHVTLNGTLYESPYDSLTNLTSLYTLGLDPTDNSVIVYPDSPITAQTIPSYNYIINGAFDFWQRGTSFSADGYCADRWYFNETGTCTAVQLTTGLPTGFRYGITMSATTSSDSADLYQCLETSDVIPLRGKTVTFSCYLKMDANMRSLGDFEIVADYSNSTDARASQTTSIGTKVLTKSEYADWAVATYSFVVPSDAVGLLVGLEPPLTTASPSTAVYYVTGAQLEVGAIATPFRRNSPTIQAELASCQRYYQKVVAEQLYSLFASGVFNTTTAFYMPMHLPVTLRTVPAFSWSGPMRVLTSGAGVVSTLDIYTYSTTNPVSLAGTITGSTTDGQAGVLGSDNSTTSYLEFDAEL